MSVGRCKCGNFKFNMHNNSLTEIPWLCHDCRDLRYGIQQIVRTSVAHSRTSIVPKQKPPVMFSLKRLELA